ncbi:MAG: O-antigen ligase [Hyphomonadaceae bacterium]
MSQISAERNEPVRLWHSIPAMAETGIVLLLLFLFSEALLGPLLASEEEPDGNPILRIMWLPVYGVVIGLGLLQARKFISMSWQMPFLVALLVLTAASVFWSIDQALTMRRMIAAGMTTVFGLHLASRYNWRELLTLFGLIWFFLGCLSYVVSVGMPALGLEQEGDHIGAWRGLWFQKNTLGGHAARSSFLFAFLLLTGTDLRRLWIAGLVLSIGLVLLSTSKTSLLGLMIGFLILGLGTLMKRGARLALVLAWFAITLGSLIVALVVFQPELVLQILGRDATLTGRTDIWAALAHVIAERPWLGHGYGAFWAPGSAEAEFVREQVQWAAPTAHNGWLETWLSVGLIGLAIFTLSFITTIGRAISAAFTGWNGIFALGFLAQFFLFSLSESSILQQNSIVWLSYASVSAILMRQRGQRRGLNEALSVRRQRELAPIRQRARADREVLSACESSAKV